MNIERIIPIDLLNQIGTKYTLSGGTVRIAKGYEGAGQIVRHFIFPSDPQAAERVFNEIKDGIKQTQESIGALQNTVLENNTLLKSMQSLQHMTIALQGINLAVSAAGFAMVINKLNKISQQIDQLDQKVDLVLSEIKDLQHYQDCIQFTKLTATLKNLESALRINDKTMALSAISRLRESQELFILVCDLYIDNKIENYFKSPELFNQHYQGALASSFAIANAFNQLGELEEAQKIIASIDTWQLSISQKIHGIVSAKTPPIWLRTITKQEKHTLKKSLFMITNTSNALEYINNTYQLCIDEKLDINALLNNERELLVIEPSNNALPHKLHSNLC